ncbi:DUF2239 family protein [Luteolibacter ambystomatis]|uniref:DUF2239 family protein n=1 Tax=Luteolibacter ambystomatis TaxID=2824561 RepID=A0A975J2D1_9BACT|nr:DUF2239 family protein [Luteolibacter ambystomatis]QUE52712.1 DUF2239 family protein [Luteolibacter ambystomatis]
MMNEDNFTAFVGGIRIAAGDRRSVVLALKERMNADGGAERMPMVFEDVSGKQVDLDLRESPEGVEGGSVRAGRGRPKLGVVAREVTLLPRHWDWLSSQPGGASVALRKLVEEARRANVGADGMRAAKEAAYQFMLAAAGDLPGYEEATRALFAGNRGAFSSHLAGWPVDLREYTEKLAAGAWEPGFSSSTPPMSS